MNKFLESLKVWFLKLIGVNTGTIPTPEPTTPVLPEIKWHGPIPQPNIKPDCNLKWVKISGDKINFDYDKLSWGATVDNTLICCFLMRNGVLEGGKFDWLREGQRVKGLENLIGTRKKDQNGNYILNADGTNVYSYYIKDLIPIVKGEEAWFCIMEVKGSHISNVIKAEGTMPKSN